MVGHPVGEVPGGGARLPQAERGEAADRGLADADHIDEPWRPVEFDVDDIAGRAECLPRPATNVGPGDDRDRSISAAFVESGQRVDALPGSVTADGAEPDMPTLVGRAPAASDATVGEEGVEIALVVPHGEHGTA